MTHRDTPRLTGQTAIVTGASSGLGRATALALSREGVDVALLARVEDDLKQAADEIAATTGRQALVLPLDLADEAALEAAAREAAATFGRVDIVVNAAGTDVPGPAEELTVQDWDRVLAVNLRAPFLLAKAAFPHMRRRGRGTIVNVSSVAGKRGWANASAYCAAKFGLTGLTQSLAAEGKPHGIRVCVLYPGGMATHWGAWSGEQRTAQDLGPPPATQALPPDEVAELIVWIVSAPPELVLNEAIVSPLEESGWP